MVPMLRHPGDPRLTCWPFVPTRPTLEKHWVPPIAVKMRWDPWKSPATSLWVESWPWKACWCRTYWNFKQGTSVMIFVRDWVMFSIWSSRNIGSTFPFHSKVSIRYGMKALGHRADWLARKAPNTSPVPSWVSGTAMSPSTKLEVVSGGTNVPRKAPANAPGVANIHWRKTRDDRSMLTPLLQMRILKC